LEQKEREREVRRAEKRVKQLEQLIADTEQQIARLEQQLEQGDTADASIFTRHAALNATLQETMTQWEEACEQLETLSL
jgi:protoheme ferro-lyase